MLFRSRRFILVATLCTALSGTGASHAQDGLGPADLSSLIDTKIRSFQENEDIVGMTLAISKNGRLIYSKGFGLSRRAQDGGERIMRKDYKSRLGSVTKAIVSVPATFKAMQEKGFDPVTKKVYGANSIFGERFSSQQRVSIDRFSPIRAMAIGPDDKIYTWYTDNTVSVGTSVDLAAHLPPRSFKMAAGKEMRDLHAVAIAPDSKVYAWYTDGTFSIGQSRHLAAHREIRRNADGDPNQYVSLPIGPDGDRKSMLDVIGIGIAKSNSHVYIWYDDGTVSSGTSTDFDHYFANRNFRVPVEVGWRYRIRGMGISADDRVYAWSSYGKAFAGNSSDLGAVHPPYTYTHPREGHQTNPYRDITVQHLFDHRSGFSRSGDVEAAARTYPLQVPAGGEPDYDVIHKHFLATRALLSPPGTRYSYSNHGIGLTTLLIKELTGQTYRDYAVTRYLHPMHLSAHVTPQTATPDSKESHAFERSGSGHTKLPFKESTTGLAAGGWTASAQGVLAVGDGLAVRYTYDQIDQMGFHRETRGKLHHSGLTGGGYAKIVLFPDGYTSLGGIDLGGIHIALAANTSNLKTGYSARVEKLLNEVVLEVGETSIPSSLNYWPEAWN